MLQQTLHNFRNVQNNYRILTQKLKIEGVGGGNRSKTFSDFFNLRKKVLKERIGSLSEFGRWREGGRVYVEQSGAR